MLNKLLFQYTRLTALLAQRLHNSFYLYLAALLSCGVLLDAGVFHIGENMRQKAFDFMVRHRVVMPKPDPDIVVVDVNEASLAALASDYGRWPWPRQVFGEFLEHLQTQKPKAVVFDILFSDPDLYNPDSDTYFNDAIAATDNTFFPFLRLAPEQDSLSKVMPSMIPGAVDTYQTPDLPTPENSKPVPRADEQGIALVLPHLPAALKAGRIGMHNIYPDVDGIVREYRLWQYKGNWRLPSLPLAVSQHLGYGTPSDQDMLVNWRGGPFTYHTVSFSDVYRDMAAKNPQRPNNEFTGKIVIVGSTAPALFDLKPTAMSKLHPGVEILATAIDNLKHGDYLHFWRGATFYVLMSLIVIWLTAGAFFKNIERDRFDKLFGFSQAALLTVSYLGISLANIYIDLTGPVTWALACFSIAKVYALANDRAMQRVLASSLPGNAGGMQVTLMIVQLETPQPLGEAILKQIRRALQDETQLECSVDELKSVQTGIWGLFGDMLGITWMDNQVAARAEAERLLAILPDILTQHGVPASVNFHHAIHAATMDSSMATAAQWRILFAQAIIKLDQRSTS